MFVEILVVANDLPDVSLYPARYFQPAAGNEVGRNLLIGVSKQISNMTLGMLTERTRCL